MFYRLKEDFALRAWKYTNCVMYHRFDALPLRVGKKAFELLLQCDGEHDLQSSAELDSLVRLGIVSPCSKGEDPSEWSRYRRYEHCFVPAMNLMLTGKCNYNCRHCFNAADNAALMTEWGWDELMGLLDQASDCGMHAITLTGGEPMLYPRFLDVVREIHRRNMVLDKLTTNGHFLTEETLDAFQEMCCNPQIKISFDGIGHHDWMRKHRGAEEEALRALRLCAKKGFRTMAQTQVFRGNLDTLQETLCVLEDAGVTSTRLIRTTETVRWQQNAPGGSLPLEEYFDRMLDLADWYLHGDHAMELIMWRYLVLSPQHKAYDMVMVANPDDTYRPTAPVCLGNRTMMAVTSDGEVIPCLQMGGYLEHHGYRFDSLKERSLQEILKDGAWLDAVCMNHYRLRENCAECDQCEWFGTCGGGCRALGLLHAGETTGELDFYGKDPLACLFFKGGWYRRVQDRLSEFSYLAAR